MRMRLTTILHVLFELLVLYSTEITSCSPPTSLNASGTILSPNYPSDFSSNETCRWEMKLGYAFKGVNLEFVFVSPLTCGAQSHVQVITGDGSIDHPCNVTSFEASYDADVEVRLVVNLSQPVPAFKIKAEFIDVGCPKPSVLIATSTTQILKAAAPRFQREAMRCSWIIHSSHGTEVNISVLEEHLRSSGESHLSIGDYGTNSLSDEELSNVKKVDFYATPSSFYQGFQLTYQAAASKACESNSQIVIASDYTRRIELRGYPGNVDLSCSWTIETSKEIMELHIDVIDFQQNISECVSDYIQLYDGGDASAPIIAKICSSLDANRTFRSTGKWIFITFKSEFFTSGKHVRLSYQSQLKDDGCISGQRLLNADFGFRAIESRGYPYFYLGGQRCAWRIHSSMEIVELRVRSQVGLKQNVSNSKCIDYIEIRDGPNQQSPIMARICTKERGGCSYASSGEDVFITFHSESESQTLANGFRLTYRAARVEGNCYPYEQSRTKCANNLCYVGYTSETACDHLNHCSDGDDSAPDLEVILPAVFFPIVLGVVILLVVIFRKRICKAINKTKTRVRTPCADDQSSVHSEPATANNSLHHHITDPTGVDLNLDPIPNRSDRSRSETMDSLQDPDTYSGNPDPPPYTSIADLDSTAQPPPYSSVVLSDPLSVKSKSHLRPSRTSKV